MTPIHLTDAESPKAPARSSSSLGLVSGLLRIITPRKSRNHQIISCLSKVALGLLAIWAVAPTQAGLVYYEGFNYPVAEDGLKNQGGFAATPSPAAGADTDIEPDSLRYMDAAGNALQTTGHHAHVDTNEEAATISNIVPVLRLPTQQPAGNELWISFVGQQTTGSTLRFFNLSLRAPDDTLQPPDSGTGIDEIVALGMPSGAGEQLWRLWDRGTNQNLWASAISTTPSTQKSLMVARVQLNAVDNLLERYTLWLNPRLDRPPVEADGFTMVSAASDFNDWSDLYQLRLAGGYDATNPSGWKVDEIRFADTWQEALPYWPLTVTSLLPGTLKDQVRIEWMAAPGFTDSVEWSTDLTQWFPYANSFRLNGPVAGPVVYETPAGGSGPRYFRVRRAF
jgi:hypothetical protein